MREPHSIPPRRPYRGDAHRRSGGGPPPAPDFGPGLAQLRAAVARHACGRRAEGMPLEHVLAEMQGLVQRAELLEGSPDELGVLLGRVRLWSLDAYLDQPELRNAPRFY